MFSKRHYYVLELQYLGFRYHGWQKQPDVITVERMVKRTLTYVLQHDKVKVLASGRTDAMVSVHHTYVELFIDDIPIDLEEFLPLFNQNLPQDIRALSIREVKPDFQIMSAAKSKEYLYLFSHGQKNHPFAAPFMIGTMGTLDIERMQQGAQLFEGTHDYKAFAYRPKPQTQTVGTIAICEIVENTRFRANFFPEQSYLLRVVGKGFKRHQIRLMMGVLFDLGEGKIALDDIRESLEPDTDRRWERIAPASGLILNRVELSQDN